MLLQHVLGGERAHIQGTVGLQNWSFRVICAECWTLDGKF